MNRLLTPFAGLIFVAVSFLNGNAQQSMIGIRLGANLANETGDLPSQGLSNSIYPCFLAGIQLDVPFNSIWAFDLQLLYDQKGVHQNLKEAQGGTDTWVTDTGATDLIYSYIEIPILLKVSFGSGNIRPYLFAGPSLGIFVAGSQKYNDTLFGGGAIFPDSRIRRDTTESIPYSSMKPFDFSAVFGGGISIKLNSGQMLFVDAAYSVGFIDFGVNSLVGNAPVESRDIRLSAGILFPLD